MTSPSEDLQPHLRGRLVSLHPLQQEHEADLLDATSDGELWNMTVSTIPGPQTVAAYIGSAIAGRDAGTVMPFVIVQTGTERILGSTRFWTIDPVNRKLEIGHTWLRKSVQRSGVNTEAKFLMLIHAFDVMNCVRVQYSTDVHNDASPAATLRIGATQEGIVRHERIMPNGRKRNSVRFSIIDSEWPTVRNSLLQKMNQYPGAK